MKKLKHITQICEEVYNKHGLSGVIDHVDFQMQMGNQAYKNVKYKTCEPCDNQTPFWKDTCLVCGQDDDPHKQPNDFDYGMGEDHNY